MGKYSTLVPGRDIAGQPFTGTPVSFKPQAQQTRRVLSSAAIRQTLPDIDKTTIETDIEGIFDESGSVRGSNDTFSARHEIFLIATEHIARRSGNKWHAKVSTFDMNSEMELPRTRLDRPGLKAVERSLLADIPGGSSNLGPALRSSEHSADRSRPRLLVVATDWELFDPDPGAVAQLIISNSATRTLLLVLNNPAPQFLDGTAVEAIQIQPNTAPAVVAELIVRAAQDVVEASHPKGETKK